MKRLVFSMTSRDMERLERGRVFSDDPASRREPSCHECKDRGCGYCMSKPTEGVPF